MTLFSSGRTHRAADAAGDRAQRDQHPRAADRHLRRIVAGVPRPGRVAGTNRVRSGVVGRGAAPAQHRTVVRVSRRQGDKPGFTATLIGDRSGALADRQRARARAWCSVDPDSSSGRVISSRAAPVADVTVQSDRARQGLKVLYGAPADRGMRQYRLVRRRPGTDRGCGVDQGWAARPAERRGAVAGR